MGFYLPFQSLNKSCHQLQADTDHCLAGKRNRFYVAFFFLILWLLPKLHGFHAFRFHAPRLAHLLSILVNVSYHMWRNWMMCERGKGKKRLVMVSLRQAFWWERLTLYTADSVNYTFWSRHGEIEECVKAQKENRRRSGQSVTASDFGSNGPGSNPAVSVALSPWTKLFTPIVPRRSLHISFY